MGTCFNFLGIPIFEDRECASARRRAKAQRKRDKYDYKTDKGKLDTIEDLYGQPELLGQLVGRVFDHADASSAQALGILGDSGAVDMGAAYLTGGTSLLGSLFGGGGEAAAPAPISTETLLIGGALLAALAYAGSR